MTAAPALALPGYVTGSQSRDQPRWAYAACRAMVLCSLFSIIFLPEFSRDGGESLSPVYSKALAGFRFIDLLILLVVFCHLVALGCLRSKRVCLPRTLALPGLGFLACIGAAICNGYTHGGSKFFFDWRGLALGIGLYFVWSFWMQDRADVAAAVRVFLVYMGLRIGLLYALYLGGYRDTVASISIPIFDGPILSCIVFTGLLAFRYQESARNWISKLACLSLAMAAYLIVVLCLRRTYWGELAVGTVLLLLLKRRHRIRSFMLTGLAVVMAAGVLGSSFSGRVLSLDVTRTDTQFSADNADHLHDLMDAWYEVRQSPVLGIGVGTSYPTWHIRNWKPESVMVHNAPLHVWLKYGIAGLLCYLWFHLALLRWLYKRAKTALSSEQVFLGTAFAYLAAQFAVTLSFAPWPYSEVQLTTLMSFIVAAAVMAGSTSESRRKPGLFTAP